jgi:integrase/recombinase XerC
MSNSYSQDGKNYEHNVFNGISTRPKQEEVFRIFTDMLDVSSHTTEALVLDVRKFAKWFVSANQEAFDVSRVTIRDITDFREFLRLEKKQAVSTINRNLSSLKKYFKWLLNNNHITVNPTTSIKELKKQPMAPQGLTRAEVRKLLREVELRKDVRAKAIFSIVLFTGARLSDVVNIELSDIMITSKKITVRVSSK